MSSASEIINTLGGIRPLARDLSIEPHSVVQGWKERGRIPVKYWPAILEIAKAKNVELTTDDLMGSSPSGGLVDKTEATQAGTTAQ